MTDYKWETNSKISKLLIELEAVKMVFDSIQANPKVEDNLRKTALLKSAVFSARIEGVQSTMTSPKKEGQNLVSAYRWIYTQDQYPTLSVEAIRHLHQLVMKDISDYAGSWRTEPWAIFDSFGNVVHMVPLHTEIPKLMNEYLDFVTQLDVHAGIRAAVAHFVFEKIHPFADGNGRVGRLISAFILEKDNCGFRGLAPFEEYIDAHREEYYLNLEPSHNLTGFVEFFLTSVVTKAREIIENVNKRDNLDPAERLLPRRREILEIIRDHPHATFDFLKRRFQMVNPKTLHYDLQCLQKTGLVRKLGVSRGVVYIVS
jgi:Fic family protein